ncbi:MAG: hypothetical protein AAGN35_19095 [Bacteroidota bacterium]
MTQDWTRTSFLILFLGILTSAGTPLRAQDSVRTRNGWHLTPEGRIHVMVVYAELDFDSTYAHLDKTKQPDGNWKWGARKNPRWKKELISKTPDGDGFMTKYFRQASFGKFQVTGDYLDTIVTVKITDIQRNGQVVTQEAFGNNLYRRAVVDHVNALENPSFGFGSKLEDFDRWTFTGTGRKNRPEPNGKIDLVVIVWRNIHVRNLGPSSGFVTPGNVGTLLGMPSDMYSIFCTWDIMPKGIMRHEFSHMLYGGNNFHTANGGAGQRTFLSTVGGYSNMSGSDRFSHTWNAWDRERMDWRNPQNQYVLSTRCEDSGTEVSGELVYGAERCGGGFYRLRDFISTGDAIKIKLPHLPEGIQSQYLWLENHQMKPGNYDHDKAVLPGLYAYITVGKDQLTGPKVFGGSNNYLWPLVAHGQHDFIYEREDKREAIIMTPERENPLTGYHYHMRMTTDLDGDGKIRVTQDVRPRTEYFLPNRLVVDGEELPKEFFSWKQYPMFGTRMTAFRQDGNFKIAIGENPAATPVYSHQGPRVRPNDNRRIYLNGLSVEIIEEQDNGDLIVRIRWDDFRVRKDRRWCGNILLTERVEVAPRVELRLEQGYSAQLAAVVQEIDGEPVFARPTILEVDSGATLELRENARLLIRKGSGLLIRRGATVDLRRKARIEVEAGAYIYVEKGAEILRGRRATIGVPAGAEIAVPPILEADFSDLADGTKRFFSR